MGLLGALGSEASDAQIYVIGYPQAGRNTSRLQRYTVNVATSLVAVIIALLGIGAIQDMTNVSCAGIMGAQQTCFQSWSFWLSFYLLTPPVLAVLVIALVAVRFADKSTKQ